MNTPIRTHMIPAAATLAALLLAGCATGSHLAAGASLAQHAGHISQAGPCKSQYLAWLKAGGLDDITTVGKEGALAGMAAQGHLPARTGTAHAAATGLARAAHTSLGNMPPPCTKADAEYATSLRDFIAAATALAHGENRTAEQELNVAEAANTHAATDARAADGAPPAH